MKPRLCKDCVAAGITTDRPAPFAGPRCKTHHLARRKVLRAAAHEMRVGKVYSLPAGAYDALYLAQGGVCAICRVATGRTKRLAVDHDHTCCPGPSSCGRCIRGLLCGPCNQLIGRLSPAALLRALTYVTAARPQ